MQVVWSCSTRSMLLWCAHSGVYLGALLRDRDADALFSDLKLPTAATMPPALAQRENFNDAIKASSQSVLRLIVKVLFCSNQSGVVLLTD